MKKISILSFLFTFALLARDEATQNLHRYFLANYYQFGNDLPKAGKWFSQIDPDKNAQYIYLGFLPYLASMQANDQIAALIPELDPLFKDNLDMQMIFATALEATGKTQKAYERFIILNQTHKLNQELAFKVAQIYLVRQPENALSVIDSYLNSGPRKPNNFIFYFIKSQIYVQLNKKAEALTAIKLAIETYPKFDKSWLLLALLQEQDGKIEDAIVAYKTYLELSTENNEEIERHLQNLMRAHGHQQKTTNDVIASKIAAVEKILKKGEFEKAAQLASSWAHEDNEELWAKTIHLLSYIGLPHKIAQQLLRDMGAKKPDNQMIQLLQADLELKYDHGPHLIPMLQSLYSKNTKPDIKAKIALQIAMLEYEQAHWDAARDILLDSLKHEPSFAPTHNMLAYLHATECKNLTKAQEHIEIALKKDPSNPHFLDTSALILYKQQKYDDATKILEKVAHACPTDVTILVHLAKCYNQQKKYESAQATLKAATAVSHTSIDKKKIDKWASVWKFSLR